MLKKSILSTIVICLIGQTSHARPNVVILFSDDLGYQDIGCYNGPVETPTLDKLAKEGQRFTQFYAGAAVCSPSRATMLTGRHHIRTGVWSWLHAPERSRFEESPYMHLLEREVTLAEILRDAGYDTAHIGKWHLGLPSPGYPKPTPKDHGFDYWFATDNNAVPSHHNPENFVRNGEPVGTIEGYSCQIVVDEAINWLETEHSKDRPFFLNIWFHEPHKKIAAPDELVSKYGEISDKGAIYSGSVDNTDQAISRLLTKLHEIDAPENTLIIYSSDNGSEEKDRVGPLRGKKTLNWEGGIRVPGIFYWPGTIAGGETVDIPAGVVDVLPTVCAMLNLDTPQGVHLDGSNIAPILTGHPDQFNRHQPMFWHLAGSTPIVAMRDGDYSLVGFCDSDLPKNIGFKDTWIPTIKTGGYKDFQLFNLKDDPGQTQDLSSQMPELADRMKKRLMEINASIMADGEDWHLYGK